MPKRFFEVTVGPDLYRRHIKGKTDAEAAAKEAFHSKCRVALDDPEIGIMACFAGQSGEFVLTVPCTQDEIDTIKEFEGVKNAREITPVFYDIQVSAAFCRNPKEWGQDWEDDKMESCDALYSWMDQEGICNVELLDIDRISRDDEGNYHIPVAVVADQNVIERMRLWPGVIKIEKSAVPSPGLSSYLDDNRYFTVIVTPEFYQDRASAGAEAVTEVFNAASHMSSDMILKNCVAAGDAGDYALVVYATPAELEALQQQHKGIASFAEITPKKYAVTLREEFYKNFRDEGGKPTDRVLEDAWHSLHRPWYIAAGMRDIEMLSKGSECRLDVEIIANEEAALKEIQTWPGFVSAEEWPDAPPANTPAEPRL